jgi:glycosyltransferase involved in cell wall biosynthesis
MIILVLTHSYPDLKNKWRGIFVKEQVKALGTRHDVILVYFKADYSNFAPFSDYSYIKKQDGRITEYEVTVNKSLPVVTQIKLLTNTYKFIKAEILSQTKPDIIHSHLTYPGGFLGTIIQQKNKIPNVITEHSTIKLYLRSWLHKQCVKYALWKTDTVISVSKSLREEIIAFCHRPVIVINNIVDVDKFDLVKTSHGMIFNIGFLGGLNSNNKGLDLLLRAVSILKRRDIVLHIGGNGALLDNLKSMAKDLGIEESCIFYGEINRSGISDFFSKLDFFVLPSRYETFGIVLIEAMACGLPVIATKCGGPEEIVTPLTGLLIEKENIEKLKQAIEEMSDNFETYNKDAIRNYADENFGQGVFIKRISELYQGIILKETE